MPSPPPPVKIEEIVRSVIQKIEKIGEESGGSGHMAYTGYNLTQIEDAEQIEDGSQYIWKIKFHYKVYFETEFTYYPDNPPQEYEYQMEIYLDQHQNVVQMGERQCVKGFI